MLKPIALKAQDVLVACKLYSLSEASLSKEDWTYVGLSHDLGISTSEVYNAFDRCRRAQLVVTVRDKEIVSRRNFCELLIHAVPRIFYAERGGLETGMPTGAHAPVFQDHIVVIKDALPTVWASVSGVRGESISPIYPSVPEAATKDPLLYDILALLDVIRIGDTRSRNTASSMLEKRILVRTSEVGSRA